MKNIILNIILIGNFSLAAKANEPWHLIKLETINQYRILNGEIEAINKATVSAQTAGRVAKLNYDIDDLVLKGSVLVEFTNTEQKSQLNQARENAKAAKIAYQQAQTDYNRVKNIYEKKLVAKSQLDTALSNRNALEAKSAAAESGVIAAQKHFEYTIIRAPYDGIVTNRFVEIGEVVNPGTAIMEGLSLSQLRVITNIPENIINQVKTNTSAIIILIDGEEINTENITIFPYADQSTHTFKSRLDLDLDLNNGQLFPGMTVKVKFKVAEKSAILIPKSAIVTRGELTMVYVISNETTLPRQIKLGSQHNDFVEVISGLNANDKITLSPHNL